MYSLLKIFISVGHAVGDKLVQTMEHWSRFVFVQYAEKRVIIFSTGPVLDQVVLEVNPLSTTLLFLVLYHHRNLELFFFFVAVGSSDLIDKLNLLTFSKKF